MKLSAMVHHTFSFIPTLAFFPMGETITFLQVVLSALQLHFRIIESLVIFFLPLTSHGTKQEKNENSEIFGPTLGYAYATLHLFTE